jgi:oxygen-independent coproporphyrinogen-3 oxidase
VNRSQAIRHSVDQVSRQTVNLFWATLRMIYSKQMETYSVYVHIPFCNHRCGYCDFNTYVGLQSIIPEYVRALCSEIETLASNSEGRLLVHTLYFGGGTPSLLPAAELERILYTLHTNFDLLPEAEITLEANPGTLSPTYLREIHSLGVNRLSLGMQSAHPFELRLLERQHTYEDVIHSVTWARQAGFDNLNLDLIFGMPEQALENWQNNLSLAIDLHPEHLSLYALTLEHDTPFGRWAERGLLSEPDPDLAADMYEWATERLEQVGYAQYEISNWGSKMCQHNLQYWRNLPYLGFGAGAHGYVASIRTANVLSPVIYLQRLLNMERAPSPPFPMTPATQTAQPVDRLAEIAETMMMGLRLTQEGVSNTTFRQRFGQSLQEIFARPIERLIHLGLLEWAGKDQNTLRLTPHGRLLGNQVFVEFI